jgi:5S rRNA maturation endonuclease (ribonuclease M5)
MAIRKKVLLVEGVNDKHVINNLLKAHNLKMKLRFVTRRNLEYFGDAENRS